MVAAMVNPAPAETTVMAITPMAAMVLITLVMAAEIIPGLPCRPHLRNPITVVETILEAATSLVPADIVRGMALILVGALFPDWACQQTQRGNFNGPSTQGVAVTRQAQLGPVAAIMPVS